MAARVAHRSYRVWLPLVAAVLAVPLAAPSASAQPLPAAAADPRPAAASLAVHRVTLLTGDTVTVTQVDAHHSTVAVDPADHVSAGEIRTTTAGDDVYVLPSTALPYVAAGLFDRALFNVTRLIEEGLADDERSTVPLIVQYTKPTALKAQSAPRGAVRTRTLDSIDASAVSASKVRTRSFWADVTGTAAGTIVTAAHPRLRDGIKKVWLDGRVQGSLAESVAQIGAPQAWAAGYDGAGVTVAVLDSGIDAEHPDLTDRIEDSRSFVPGETVQDVTGHGTHVASTVLGSGAASGGTERGVAPGAKLIVGKVLGEDGVGQDSWIIDGMEWAATHAAVVNMSLGSPEPSDGTDPMSQALNELSEDTGTLFVVAAGNTGVESGVSSPGAADDALTVGAVDSTDTRAWFSSIGPRLGDQALKPDLVAPGVDILAARSQYSPGDGPYVTMSGTSMATPHVTGSAAILAQRHPDWDGAQIKDALMSTAKELDGATAYQVGSGRVDVGAASSATVTATGSVFFGFDRWPHSSESPVTRTITYRNSDDTEVTLQLDLDLRDNDGSPAPTGLISSPADRLTVPAHGTGSVEVTLDPSLAADGQRYLGRVIAAVGGQAVAHTTLGFVKENERYDLTVHALDRQGHPAQSYVEVVGGPAGYDVWPVDGTTTRRLPPGTYSLATWLDVDTDTDHQGVALLMQPEVTLDQDRTVTLDARRARPVTAEAPVRPLSKARTGPPLEATYQRMGWYRRLGETTFESAVMMPVWIDAMYATPTARVQTGDFELNTRWRLRDPLLAVRGPGGWLDVTAQAGAPFFEGTRTLPVVVAGQGSPDDFAAVDARGKIAIVERSDAVSPYDRAVAAREAGAAVLLVVNDRAPELSEWYGGPNGEDVGIPVGAVSGTEGSALLAAPPDTMQVTGSVDSDTVYDLQDPHPGYIPSRLAYRPSLRELARVDARYTSDRPSSGGEFRYDFRPYTIAGVGFLQVLSLPQIRTEWVSAPKGSTWYQEAMVLDPAWDVRGVRRALRPGSRTTSTWFAPVVRPRIGTGYWGPNRSGSFMSLNLPSFADSGAGHTGDMYGVAGQHIDLYTGGKLIKSADDQALWVDVASPTRLRYRVVSTATRDPARWRTSTRSTTTWRFWSSEPAGGSADLPFLSLDYSVATDMTGRVGPGPTRLRLSAVQVTGAADAGRVVAGRLWASYDGGRTWKPVKLKAAGTGVWKATVPRAASPRGTVSLRATARDSRGNSIRQVVIDTYRLR